MKEDEVSRQVIGCAIEVHKELGPGLLESVYEEAMCCELDRVGLEIRRQSQVPIRYKGTLLATPLRLDLIVEDIVIVENKAKENVLPIDKQQLLTYLRLTELRLGLLINFNVTRLTNGLSRVIN